MRKIAVFGPGPAFKGGIANYNTSLAKAFQRIPGTEIHIFSWTQQYPAIIPRDFKDRKSRSDQLEGTDIRVHYLTNYNNPITWYKTYRLIRDIKPELIIFQWSLSIQGIPLGWIAGKVMRNSPVRVVFDLHFVKQKEGSRIDRWLTKMGIGNAHQYVVHSLQTAEELKELFRGRKFDIVRDISEVKDNSGIPCIRLFHPVYDMFKPDDSLDTVKLKQELNLRRYVFLFFGFIRKYKGLHNAIEAFAKLAEKRNDVSLLIVGEAFWQTLDKRKFSTRIKNFLFSIVKLLVVNKEDDERDYFPLELINGFGINDKVTSVIEYIPNEDVHKYFQVSDAILLFYSRATPSGVESIAYNFRLPILATRTGHFPETIKDGFNGYLAELNDTASMAEAMEKIIEKPVKRKNIALASKEMSWDNYAKAILG